MFNDNFVQDCLNGKAKFTDLDKYIEYWHKNKLDISLRKFLGLTEHEYELWDTNKDNTIFLIKTAKLPKSEVCEMNYNDTDNNKFYHITRNQNTGKFTLFENNNGKITKIKTRTYPDFF